MAIHLIYNHIDHHARHSGYDQLAKHVTGEAYRSGGLTYLISRKAPWSVLDRIPYYQSPWYDHMATRREIEICLRMLVPRHDLYHFLYAENDLRITSLWKLKLNNRIVGSFHQPPEYLHTHIEDKRYIEGMNAAVVVSESQIPYLEQYLPRESIYHVPHGVETGFWSPDPGVPRHDRPTFLCVGQWLRDIDLVVETIGKIGRSGADIQFKVVTFEQHAAQFEGLGNVEVMWGISDEELREHYRRAHALFLPLKMSTANNAVLEAMACGTGIVSTDTGGVPEYLDQECGALIEPGDADGAAAALLDIAGDRGRADRMGAAARRRAERLYRWELVGDQMNEAYRQILGGA